MIKLFNQTDTIFANNGEKIINPMRAKVFKEDNGSFYLDLETSLSYVNDITQGRIIVAPTPQGEQAFRIGSPEVTKHKIIVRCKHVYFDRENYLIEDSYVVDKNCNDALDHLNSATSDVSPFQTISNIQTIASYRCVRKSLKEADDVVLERWGGHLVRNNFTVGIMATIGQDNGVTVRYKKNLKDIDCQENWENVVTRLMPVGKDGLLLPEKYVYSENKYDIPYTKCVSFEQNDIIEDDYKDENGNLNEESYINALIDNLRLQAQDYINENCVPKVNYTLKANLEKITDIGDTIEVIDERLNLNITTNLISYVYDCILGKYEELEFGNFKKKLSNLVETISNVAVEKSKQNTETLKVTLSSELNEATGKIWSLLGSSNAIYDGDKILFVDKLPKETAQNVLMISGGGIGFSTNGINGQFNSAWTIDGTLDMQQINVINLVADMIKGGTLKLGANLNQYGLLEVYDESNSLIAELNKNGLKMYGKDHSYILINNDVGFVGYDSQDNRIYWIDGDEFHQKKSVVEEEITIANKLREIPITITENGVVVNDGIGYVPVT